MRPNQSLSEGVLLPKAFLRKDKLIPHRSIGGQAPQIRPRFCTHETISYNRTGYTSRGITTAATLHVAAAPNKNISG